MRLAVVVLVTALLLVATPAELRAQVIRGVLIDNVNQQPLPGTFVTLTDEAGRELRRTMSNAEGQFLIEAPGPGAYRLRCKRIGFRPQTSESLTLERGQRLTYRLALNPIAVHLPEVVIEGERQCDLHSERGGQAVPTLWEEIREALGAVSWSARVPGYWYETSVFERDRSSSGGRVRRDSMWSRTGFLRVPFRSAPADELASQGYVRKDGDELVYFAPDADALLSDPFVKTHCFEVRIGRGERNGLVGLAFTPTPDRYLSDVRGTLWLNRQTSELRYLEFTYTMMPHELKETGAGGRIEFLRLPSGAWIVRDWVIRMPLVHATGPMGVREAGGRALKIKSREGAIIYATDLAILEGTVFDSTAGTRLRDAVVSILGTNHSARTDATGHYRFAAPLQGRYAVVFAHARLDSLGLRLAEQTVDLRPGVHATVPLSIPSETSVVALLCPDSTGRTDTGVAFGIAREGSRGVPVGGAEIWASWQRITPIGADVRVSDLRAETRTDATGAYRMCGLPVGPKITMVARRGGVERTRVTLTLTTSGGEGEPQVQRGSGRIWKQDFDVSTTVHARADSTRRAPLRRLPDVLTLEEIEAANAIDAYRLVEQLRPTWLHYRGPVSLRDPAAGLVVVYVDGMRYGRVPDLQNIPADDVVEIRFLNASAATQRYGTGHAGGVIAVRTH